MSSARFIVVACTQKDRWFDLDSERTPGNSFERSGERKGRLSAARDVPDQSGSAWMDDKPLTHHEAGAPPLDCWLIDDDDPPLTTEEPPMSEARFLIGDVFDRMAELPDNSVDLIVTSPPFLALRSYLPSDHKDKAKEIGSEPTPAAFLSTLLALTREWRRILTPTGSLCVELGDTYSGGEVGTIGAATGYDALRKHQPHSETRTNGGRGPGWPPQKSLCLIPALFAGSLAYGRNLLQPDDLLEPWKVRNLIIWHRPNPPVGALGDKVRPSTSYVTVACTAKDRWFDLDSERTETKPHGGNMIRNSKSGQNGYSGFGRDVTERVDNPAGAPPLDCWIEDRLAQSDEPIHDAPDADVWTIPTAPYAGSHYATFPPALPRRLINLMAPRQVCTSCGEPRRRITSEPEYVQSATGVERSDLGGKSWHDHTNREFLGNAKAVNGRDQSVMRRTETLGWSDCGHNTWRRGIVCDPFCGSGTTLQAASELGRDSIGIDLDRRNLELARQRLGMFLVEEDEVPA